MDILNKTISDLDNINPDPKPIYEEIDISNTHTKQYRPQYFEYEMISFNKRILDFAKKIVNVMPTRDKKLINRIIENICVSLSAKYFFISKNHLDIKTDEAIYGIYIRNNIVKFIKLGSDVNIENKYGLVLIDGQMNNNVITPIFISDKNILLKHHIYHLINEHNQYNRYDNDR